MERLLNGETMRESWGGRRRMGDEKTQTIRKLKKWGWRYTVRERDGTSQSGRRQWRRRRQRPGQRVADDKPNGASLSPPLFTSLHLSGPLSPPPPPLLFILPFPLSTSVIMHAWRRLIILPSHCVNINKTALFGNYPRSPPSISSSPVPFSLLRQSICRHHQTIQMDGVSAAWPFVLLVINVDLRKWKWELRRRRAGDVLKIHLWVQTKEENGSRRKVLMSRF